MARKYAARGRRMGRLQRGRDLFVYTIENLDDVAHLPTLVNVGLVRFSRIPNQLGGRQHPDALRSQRVLGLSVPAGISPVSKRRCG